MKKEMWAAVIRGPKNLRIEKVPIPEIDDRSILVKIHKSAICNSTDYNIWDGSYIEYNSSWIGYPHILGHECSGEIVEIGSKVKGFRIGDRISFGSKMGEMDGGGFSEYSRVYPEKMNSITKLADNLSYEEGALLEPLYGVLGGMRSLDLKPGDTVVVLGLGPIGLLYVQAAKIGMASAIIGIGHHENRIQKARELGADFVINSLKEDMVKSVLKKFGEVDKIVDTTGSKAEIIDQGIKILKPGGKYLIHGHAMGKTSFMPMYLSGKGIVMSGIFPGHFKSMMVLGNKLVSQGLINLKTLITHRITLSEVEKGILMCKEKPDEVIKIIVDMESIKL